MKKFLQRVLEATDGIAPLARRDLKKRLDHVQAGLGGKAIDYVLYARDETVRSSLAALASKTQLEIAGLWRDHDGTRTRRSLLEERSADIALHSRYALVLGASVSVLPSTIPAAGQ